MPFKIGHLTKILLTKTRWKIVTWLTIKATEVSGIVLKERNWPYQIEDYQKMVKDSLGYQYHQCISTNKIEYKANLIKHDMKHLILGYDMTIRNELNIVAFLLGNKSANKVSLIYLMTCLVFVPEYIPKLKTHYKRGQNAKRLNDFNLSDFVEKELNGIRLTLEIDDLNPDKNN